MEDNRRFITVQGKEEKLKLIEDLQKSLKELKEEKKLANYNSLTNDEDCLNIEEEMFSIQTKIKNLDEIVNESVVKLVSNSNKIVSFGKTVTIKNLDTEEITKYQIVGTIEADPLKNKISNICPMGKKLLGLEKEEEFFLNEYDYQIIEIE